MCEVPISSDSRGSPWIPWCEPPRGVDSTAGLNIPSEAVSPDQAARYVALAGEILAELVPAPGEWTRVLNRVRAFERERVVSGLPAPGRAATDRLRRVARLIIEQLNGIEPLTKSNRNMARARRTRSLAIRSAGTACSAKLMMTGWVSVWNCTRWSRAHECRRHRSSRKAAIALSTRQWAFRQTGAILDLLEGCPGPPGRHQHGGPARRPSACASGRDIGRHLQTKPRHLPAATSRSARSAR